MTYGSEVIDVTNFDRAYFGLIRAFPVSVSGRPYLENGRSERLGTRTYPPRVGDGLSNGTTPVSLRRKGAEILAKNRQKVHLGGFTLPVWGERWGVRPQGCRRWIAGTRLSYPRCRSQVGGAYRSRLMDLTKTKGGYFGLKRVDPVSVSGRPYLGL